MSGVGVFLILNFAAQSFSIFQELTWAPKFRFAGSCSTDRACRKSAPLENSSMDVLSEVKHLGLICPFLFWRRNTKLFADGAISFAVINFCSLYHKFREVSLVHD